MAEAWLRAAQRLKLGQKGRAFHGCSGSSSGPTLLISNDREKWSGWCFRCHETVIEWKPVESFAERVKRMREEQAADEEAATTASPPQPANFDIETWPIEARLWLLKASIGRSEVGKLGAYHHARTNRVVLPVVDDGRIVYWQARSVDGREPKYIGAAIDKRHVVAVYGQGDPVLVEDILSAFRVGQSGVAQGMAILGTALNDRVLARLIQQQRPVTVWLDPDSAGREAARGIVKRLSLVGLNHRQIATRRDPKLLSKGEIKSLLTPRS
ncbi:toprim domain-containing protein [Burkholderia cenocepacia]|uniref:toprim domain-containing protein n=1 Tax=Burkholderia cenocepacia TaxID=95486 RepID=UPI002AB25980|nr:toprim domain-containing protein [Burkholderia cenocepacia]